MEIEEIKKIVCDVVRIKPSEISSASRKGHIMFARKSFVFYSFRKCANKELIARIVSRALSQIYNYIETYPYYERDKTYGDMFNQIKDRINEN
ncbi:MAG: hypothetical protein Q8861_02050 [Bacteroidota bacterium]|nr:hypothetical protein [Bacteroidota bacterium]